MVKTEEHKQKMQEIKMQADTAQGTRQKELLKCYHRMQKELAVCNRYLKERKRDGRD